jgi:signal peptidase I
VTGALLSLAVVMILAVTGLLLANRRRLLVVTVDGPSMQPTYYAGDRILVRRASASSIRTGDVVVVERPDDHGHWLDHPDRDVIWLVKRVAAVPGSPVPDCAPALTGRGAGRVPPGNLVLLGDNPANSNDSRYLGYFPAGRLLGIVIRRLSPHLNI